MRALTLHQPWASLIACGIKTTETRSWKPPDKLLGQRIGIHAGVTAATGEVAHLLPPYMRHRKLPTGIIATAVVWEVGCVTENDGTYARLDTRANGVIEAWPVDPYGNYAVGRWIWLLRDVRVTDPPYPCRGYLGLWRIPEQTYLARNVPARQQSLLDG